MRLTEQYSNLPNSFFKEFTSSSKSTPKSTAENIWSKEATYLPMLNEALVTHIYDPARQTYSDFSTYLRYENSHFGYIPNADTYDYFKKIPSASINRVMDGLAKYGNNTPANFSPFNESEKILSLIFMGSLLANMHTKDTYSSGIAPYVPYGEMNSRLKQYIQEIKNTGESNITIGDCSQIHTFLAKQAAEMGFSAHTVIAMTRGPHLVTFLQGADNNISFLDYSTFYPTESKDLSDAILVYEGYNFPELDGQVVYDSNEKMEAIVRTKTTEQIDKTINNQKGALYFSETQKKRPGLNLTVGNQNEQIHFEYENSLNKYFDFNLQAGGSITPGKSEDSFSSLYGGYTQGNLTAKFNLCDSNFFKIDALSEVMGSLGAFHINMNGETNKADYIGGLAYYKQQFNFYNDDLSFSLGALTKSGYLSYNKTIKKSFYEPTIENNNSYFRPDETAYNLRLGYKLPGKSTNEIYTNFIAQTLWKTRNSQDYNSGFFWDDKIAEMGIRADLYEIEADLLLSYDNQPQADTYLAKLALTKGDYGIGGEYRRQVTKCDYIESKNGYGVDLTWVFLREELKQSLRLSLKKELLRTENSIALTWSIEH